MLTLPFEDKIAGRFNGDMFYDWYNNKPTDEKELFFWTFLHDWETNILLKANKKIFNIIEKHILENK